MEKKLPIVYEPKLSLRSPPIRGYTAVEILAIMLGIAECRLCGQTPLMCTCPKHWR